MWIIFSPSKTNNNNNSEIRVKTEDGDYVTVVPADIEEAPSPDTSNIVDLTMESDDENNRPTSPKRRRKSGSASHPSSPVDVKPDVNKLKETLVYSRKDYKEQATQTVKVEQDRDLEKSYKRCKNRLENFQKDVFTLLKMIIPTEDIGTADVIDETIREMIRQNTPAWISILSHKITSNFSEYHQTCSFWSFISLGFGCEVLCLTLMTLFCVDVLACDE